MPGEAAPRAAPGDTGGDVRRARHRRLARKKYDRAVRRIYAAYVAGWERVAEEFNVLRRPGERRVASVPWCVAHNGRVLP